MTVWLPAAIVVLLTLVPAMVQCARGPLLDRLAGLELASVLATVALVLLAAAAGESFMYDVALAAAFLSVGAALVFVDQLEQER